MTSPFTSAFTSTFATTGSNIIDALLNEEQQKWGGGTGTGAALTFSFTWANGQSAQFQNNYSSSGETTASVRYGFNSIQQSAARTALQAWANIANLSFGEVADTLTNVGDFRFAFSSALPSGTWGWCSYPDDFWASAADVWVNSSISNQSTWSAGSYNLEALMHEIGHGLGLKHPGDYNAGGGGTPGPYLPTAFDSRTYTIMSYNDKAGNSTASFSFNPTTPMVLDVQAIQYLYGANTSFNATNTTYSFNDSTTYHQTIWDAGGNDSIQYTGARASTIDLQEGHGSTIGNAVTVTASNGASLGTVSNVWIAFGAVIENATGGTGNDTIIGNAGNNTLMGSGGNDSIDGVSGIDTALYAGKMSNFSITKSGSVYTVRDTTGAEGTDTLTNIEFLKFSDTNSFDIALSTATRGVAVAARGASDAASAIALQMAVVYTGRPLGSDLIQSYAAMTGGGQPNAATLASMANLAIQDGAFKSTDSSKDVVIHTFNNIMGFLPSAFEQNAWAQYIDNGTLTKTNAPWIIFQSYLGATNVPDVYKLPTQARFVAAQTFSDYTLNTSQIAALDSLNSKFATAARAWLAPISSIALAATKMTTMIADIATVTVVGVAPSSEMPASDLFGF